MRAPWPLLLLALCAAGPPGADPDWPCVQRLVPHLSAGTLWAGHAPAGSWRDDPRIPPLVAATAPRSVSLEQGTARLEAFIAATPRAERPETLARAFAGLVEATDEQRSRVIERLREIARRQRNLAATTERVTAELDALPADAPAERREEIAGRRAFLIRDFQEIERTIRYACEVPVQLEARLGRFARVLQQGLE